MYIKHFFLNQKQFYMFMLPNAGIHFSFRKISEEHKQGNGPTITEVRFQTKQLRLFLEVYFFYDELDDLNPTHFLDSVRGSGNTLSFVVEQLFLQILTSYIPFILQDYTLYLLTLLKYML